jgi:hypothetical protein
MVYRPRTMVAFNIRAGLHREPPRVKPIVHMRKAAKFLGKQSIQEHEDGRKTADVRALLDTWAAPMSVQAGSRLARRDSFLPRRSRLRRLTVAKQPNAIEWRPYRENAKNRLCRGSLE